VKSFLGSNQDMEEWDSDETNTDSYKAFLEAADKQLKDANEEARRNTVEEMVKQDAALLGEVDISPEFREYEEDDRSKKEQINEEETRLSLAERADYEERSAAAVSANAQRVSHARSQLL